MFADTAHKKGDTLKRLAFIPASFPDGFFLGWTMASQVRTTRGELVADLTLAWVDPAVDTRCLEISCASTSGWPLGVLEFDIQFVRTSDGFKLSTRTVRIEVLKEVTLP